MHFNATLFIIDKYAIGTVPEGYDEGEDEDRGSEDPDDGNSDDGAAHIDKKMSGSSDAADGSHGSYGPPQVNAASQSRDSKKRHDSMDSNATAYGAGNAIPLMALSSYPLKNVNSQNNDLFLRRFVSTQVRVKVASLVKFHEICEIINCA
jgi:hypothetical protein